MEGGIGGKEGVKEENKKIYEEDGIMSMNKEEAERRRKR